MAAAHRGHVVQKAGGEHTFQLLIKVSNKHKQRLRMVFLGKLIKILFLQN